MRRSPRRTLPLAVIALAVLATGVTAFSAPSSADDKPTRVQAFDFGDDPTPGGFPSWQAFYTEQAALNAAGEQLLAGPAVEQPGSGYSGLTASPEQRKLVVYWHGPVPDSSLDWASTALVPVEFRAAPYSEAELIRASKSLIAVDGVNEAGPLPDGSGLTIQVEPSLGEEDLIRLRRQAEIPLIISISEPPAPWNGDPSGPPTPPRPSLHFPSKADDSPAYWGAARFRSDAGPCSSGFAVEHKGSTRMATAGHCLWLGAGGSVIDGGTDDMGTTEEKSTEHDTGLISAPSGPYMYTGGYKSSAVQPVKGTYVSQVGQQVCRSSSFSDQACGLTIVAVNQTWKMTIGGQLISVGPLVVTEQSQHTSAGGPGDSGGSIFVPLPIAAGGVLALGTLTGGGGSGTSAPCTGVPDGPGRHCSWRMAYVDINSLLAYYGATLLVS